MPYHEGSYKDIAYWRDEIFVMLLIFVTPLSIVALIPSVYMAFSNGFLTVAIADLFCFALLITIMFVPGVPLNVRKLIFILMIYGLCLVLLFYLSPSGAGLLFLLTITVLSSVIYSTKGGRYSAWANTFICIGVGIVIHLKISVPITSAYDTPTWIAITSNVVFLSFVCAECINLLLNGLRSSIDDLKTLSAKLTSIIESTDAHIYSLDTDFRYIAFNQALKQSLINTYLQEIREGDKAFAFFEHNEPAEATFWKGIYTEVLTGKSLKFEQDFDSNGHQNTTSFSMNPILDGTDVVGLSCFASDVTSLKRARVEIQALNDQLEVRVEERTRALVILNEELEKVKDEIRRQNDDLEQKVTKRTTQYAFISQINQSIVHIKNEDALFSNACRIAHEIGKFKIVWVGMFDDDRKKITLTEHRGIAVEDIGRFTDISLKSKGPQESVMRSGSYFLCNNIDREPELESWKQFASAKGVVSCMIVPIKKSGDTVGTFNFYSSEQDFFSNEEIILLMEVAGDISFALDNFEKERKHKVAETLVIQNEKRFRSLVENGADAVAILSEAGSIGYMSTSVSRILGYSEGEIMKRNVFSLLHDDDLNDAKKVWKRMIDSPGIPILSPASRVLHKDGTWLWLETTITNMFDDPTIGGVVNNFRDVTQRVLAEKGLSTTTRELERTLSDLQKIMNASMDMICSIDEEGRFVSVSAASERILGYEPDELLSTRFIDMVWKEDVDRTQHEAIGIMSGMRVESFENRYIHKNGSIVPILWSATWDSEDRIMYCIAKDVTERNKLDVEKQALIERLQSNIKDLYQFSYIVSHNLRAPIAKILGLVSVIDNESEENRFLLGKLTEEAEHLDDVVKDINIIVSARKSEKEKMEEVVFETELGLVTQVMEDAIRERHAIIEMDFTEVRGFSTIKSYLYSILYNLVSNSIKYCMPGVPLRIKIKSSQDDKYICLSVVDNGIGIDLAKNGSKVFGLYKRFHTGSIPGKGIGLNLVKTHAETLGGRVEIESEIGKGTTFRVFFSKTYGTDTLE